MGDYCLLYRLSINFFLALISMNIRILSGFLFLLAAVVTIPLVFLVVTLIIPILFFIIAIMMFARRNKVETVPAYYNDDYGQLHTMMNVNIMIITNLILDLEMIIMKRTIIKVITMNMNNHETKRKIEIQEDNLEKNVDKRSI